jgi:hypothetical protein
MSQLYDSADVEPYQRLGAGAAAEAMNDGRLSRLRPEPGNDLR